MFSDNDKVRMEIAVDDNKLHITNVAGRLYQDGVCVGRASGPDGLHIDLVADSCTSPCHETTTVDFVPDEQGALPPQRISLPQGRSAMQLSSHVLRVACLRGSQREHQWHFRLPDILANESVALTVQARPTSKVPSNAKLMRVQWMVRRKGSSQQPSALQQQTLRFDPALSVARRVFVIQGPLPGTSVYSLRVRQVVQADAVRYTVGWQRIQTNVVDVSPVHHQFPSGSKRRAVIVGVSDYRQISDLHWCDEDATLWWRYLGGMGFQIQLLGDETSPYPIKHQLATVRNVSRAIRAMATDGVAEHMVFVSSGHGAGDGSGNSYLCMLSDPEFGQDGDEVAGKYTDKRLADDLALGSRPDSWTFCVLDHCFSGGMLPEMKNSVQNIFATSTCTEDGYGYVWEWWPLVFFFCSSGVDKQDLFSDKSSFV